MEREARALNNVARMKRETLELDSIRRLRKAASYERNPFNPANKDNDTGICTRQQATKRAAKNARVMLLQMTDGVSIREAATLVQELEAISRSIDI